MGVLWPFHPADHKPICFVKWEYKSQKKITFCGNSIKRRVFCVCTVALSYTLFISVGIFGVGGVNASSKTSTLVKDNGRDTTYRNRPVTTSQP